MKLAKLISSRGNLFTLPWGATVNSYSGFILVSRWFLYREKSLSITVLWTMTLMTLVFFTCNQDTFKAMQTNENGCHKFWLGKHAW